MATIFKRAWWRVLRLVGYERAAWNDQFQAGVWCREPRSPRTLSRVGELCKGGKLVEFGCGEGDLPPALPAGTFSSYLGIDISDVAVKRAREKAAKAGILHCEFQQGDMAGWGGAESVSLILAEECLYYLNAHEAATFLRRCSDSLLPDGSILVIIHDADKHDKTIAVCRAACTVQKEERAGTRIYLTLVRTNSF